MITRGSMMGIAAKAGRKKQELAISTGGEVAFLSYKRVGK
jgi:hypothetical protein